MSVLNEIHQHRDIILKTAEECGLTDIRVFGSVARGEETAVSDIDLLVNVANADDPLAFVDFQNTLSEIFSRKIDLVFESGLYRMLRTPILNEAKPI